MRTRNRKNLRRDRLKQYLKAKYGMKYDNGGKTGEGNPPEADFLLKRDPLADYDRETVGVGRGAQDLDTGGFTTASDNARAQMDFLVPPEGMEPERGPEDMEPIRKLGPKVIRRDQKRGLMKGGPAKLPVAENSDGFEEMLYRLPSTSNMRVMVPSLGGGQRAYGWWGYNDKQKEAYRKADQIPYGFRMNGESVVATPETLKMLQEQGTPARGQVTEDTLRELYQTNPEMFGKGSEADAKTYRYINQKAMDEAKRLLRNDFSDSYYFPDKEYYYPSQK